ncbi:MAG: sigma-70 family RNA polymerase sigma factor [Dehalococcoidia bacterium]|nr:sigma-70 family RNA polymerase sigma factor [Dehalococcoidia bacterium]
MMANLVEKWQQGDRDAFEELFHSYYNMVRRTAIGILHDGGCAEDVVQEVFVSAWRSRHSFDSQKGSLATWLHRITVNQCARHGKKSGAKDVSLEEAQSRGFQISVNTDCSTQQPDTNEFSESERMMAAIQSLNGTYRPVVVLRYLNDLPYSEIAQVLEIPLGTVKSRLSEAVKILRRKFTGEEAK